MTRVPGSRYYYLVKHDSPEFKALAEQGMILRCEVGSGLLGTALEGQQDRDEMGICVEPPEYVAGLRQFEQYIHRARPEGVRSEPGDLELVVYSLRKWTRLALNGNPTVLLLLFVPENEVAEINDFGRELRANAPIIVSRQAGHRFRGYLAAQRDRMLGNGSQRTNRPELIEKHGFDTKFAMHMVRLGLQGVELLETGKITLPIPEPWRTWLRELRKGEHAKDEALDAAAELDAQLEKLIRTSPLPEHPDHAAADEWLVRVHREAWKMA
ncbi:nucleotidyltransferase domain-containing protein [Amycolatopsis xylanica]|nr:nucleotidyltransferase domain-containing protein [Amycolatopsis xylanica]